MRFSTPFSQREVLLALGPLLLEPTLDPLLLLEPTRESLEADLTPVQLVVPAALDQTPCHPYLVSLLLRASSGTDIF